MTQWDSLADAYGNNGSNDGVYGCKIRILDANRTTIGWQAHTRCSSVNPLSVNGKLESSMAITPEAKNDYVQFTLGAESWASSQQGLNISYCKVDDWDGSDDPAVSGTPFSSL